MYSIVDACIILLNKWLFQKKISTFNWNLRIFPRSNAFTIRTTRNTLNYMATVYIYVNFCSEFGSITQLSLDRKFKPYKNSSRIFLSSFSSFSSSYFLHVNRQFDRFACTKTSSRLSSCAVLCLHMVIGILSSE